METNKIIQSCVAQMQRADSLAGGGRQVRWPNRPLLVIFLGHHAEENRDEVRKSIRLCWPVLADAVQYLSFETPDAYRAAISEDPRDGAIPLEDALLEQCNPQKGFHVHTDPIIAYFLDAGSSETPEFLRLLNAEFAPAAVGVITRFLFSVCRGVRNADRRRMKEHLRLLDEYAHDPENQKRWENSYLFAVSDQMRNGAALTSPAQFTEGYILLTELLLVYNSRPADGEVAAVLPLPRGVVPLDKGNFITGAILRITKPREEIVRSVLREYVNECSARFGNAGEAAPVESIVAFCRELLLDRYSTLVEPILPAAEDLRWLPVADLPLSPASAGEDGGAGDLTHGCWRAFKEKHFVSAVREACGADGALLEYFKRELSSKYKASDIRMRFPAVGDSLSEELFRPTAPGGADLASHGVFAAKQAFAQLALPALRSAVAYLYDVSSKYQETLVRLQGELHCEDKGIVDNYSDWIRNYIAANPAVSAEMTLPCREDAFGERLKDFFSTALNNCDFLRLPFDKELERRIGEAEANHQILNSLNVPDDEMQLRGRMHVDGYESTIGNYILLDPDARYARDLPDLACSNFEVRSSDCVDRISFYAFRRDRIL